MNVHICETCGGFTAPRPSSPDGACGCEEVLGRYGDGQHRELLANRHKGGRHGWRIQSPELLLADVHHHVAKLHVATCELLERRRDAEPRELPWDGDIEDRVREFAYDTGNMTMMLLDALRLLDDPG